MVALPRSDFRGLELSFDEFYDLVLIGMASDSGSLVRGAKPSHVGGMVNYKRVADNLGLKYDPKWIDDVGRELDNYAESIASHDGTPDGEDEDPYWVYLNSGFERIAELLRAKYYKQKTGVELSYTEFRDVLLYELGGMTQDGVSEDGGNVPIGDPIFYNISKVVRLLDLSSEPGWIEHATNEWLEAKFIVRDLISEDTIPRYRLTQEGFARAESLAETLNAGSGFLFNQGKGTLYFSVDASHISRLGLELVAKQETAVAELVKNGYDADATNVDLIFNLGHEGKSSLEVFDNGSGMNLEQLEAGFMRLSTPNKVASPHSEIFKRQKAGRKGIGRFAAQRLGHHLVLETTTSRLQYALRLEIDWDKFEAQRNLTSIANTVTRIKKSFKQGTRLTISQLRDSWSDAQIERSHRHIGELIQPFPLSRNGTGADGDPGFKSSFAKVREDDLEIVADEWSLYFKHALAEIEGKVDENGFGSWSLKSEKFDLQIEDQNISPRREISMEPYAHLRQLQFRAFYYIDKETQRAFRSKVAEKLKNSGGVRLYRNGFRVLPYGERFDDWLKLNASNLGRKVLPPHSNRNFLGFVEIYDVDGSQFEETSSREGLLENESFVELKDFVSAVLKTAILPIAEARNRRLTTTDTRQKQRSPKGQANDLLNRLTALQESAENDPRYAAALSEVLDTVRESVLEIGNTGESLLEELGMMRVLASLGLTIGEFTHEIRLSLEAIKASAVLLESQAETDAQRADQTRSLPDQIADFEGYLSYFDSTVRDNVKRDVSALEVRDIVNAFLPTIAPKLNRNELQIKTNFDGLGLFVRPMHRSEWTSVLINLFTNSLKAIRRSGKMGVIRIDCGRIGDKIYLDFMDNGDGIAEKNATRIFEPFFTTTSATGASEEDGTFAGMGMGLKIVKDIVDSAHGEITLQDPPSGFSTCFRVTMPQATDQEMPENAY